MPSGHSQNSALFATFLILKLLGEGINISLIIKIAIIGGLSLSVMASRWVFKCHTVGQITNWCDIGDIFRSNSI